MNPADLPNVLAGIDHPCPRCDAEPGQMCVSVKTGAMRATTHRERKPKGDNDAGR